MDFQAMGKRIRRKRRYEDITQEKLAEMVGVSTSFIGHIERGSRTPAIETMWKICKALDITMDFAVSGE